MPHANDLKGAKFRDARAHFFAAFDAVIVLDRDYKIVDANEKFLSLYRLTREQCIGRSCHEITHHRSEPCGSDEHPCPFLMVCETGNPVKSEHIHKDTQDANQRHEIFCYPLLDEESRVEYIVEVIRDVTHFKKAESIIQKDAERSAFLLGLHARDQKLPEEEIHKLVLDKAVSLTDSEVGGIYLVDENQKNLRLLAWSDNGLDDDARNPQRARVMESAEAWIDCIWSKQPEVRNESKGNPLKDGGIQRCACLPLVEGNRVHMLIGVANKQSDYDAEDIAQLRFVANELEKRVARIRAEKERAAHTDYLRKLNDITVAALESPDLEGTLATLSQQLGRIVGANYCCITLWDEASHSVAICSGSDHARTLEMERVEEAVARTVLANDQTLIVEDMQNKPPIDPAVASACPAKALLGLPLICDDKKLGAAMLGFNEARVFTVEDIKRCEQAASQVSLAIYKARLFEETKRHAEELETLARVSAAMRKANSRDEIGPNVLTKIMELFDGVGAALGIYDENAEKIIIEKGLGVWGNWTGVGQPTSSGITGRVFETAEPYITDDLQSDQLFLWKTDEHPAQCGACFPLTANEQVVGVLWLGRQIPFDKTDLRLLSAIADMTANALQRQSLHEDLRENLEDLREAQALLIQSEKLAAIGQLVSGIAHELNNPLTSVVLYAQMLQRRLGDDGVKHDLDNIVAESLRASKIVRGLLDFSRQRPAERRTVNVNDILKSVIDFVSHELKMRGIQCDLDLSTQIPLTLADPHQLQQVFINLVTNAWQAMSGMPQGGRIWIKTELGLPRYKIVRTGTAVIRITIQDNGPGVSEELATRVFDPFFTTKSEGSGTGLGLSICHGIVSQHGGHIWVDEKTKDGATFIVELPIVSPEKAEEAYIREKQNHEAPAGARVLILDDEPAVLAALSRALNGKGYQVDAIENPKEGMGKALNNDYAFILCDVRMPGMLGPDFYTKVISQRQELEGKIIFISGDVTSGPIGDFIREKNAPCLVKPFELDDLFDIINSVNG